ncbi:MAG: hypothetical protein ACE5EF_12405 [Dehalococcoidia bacterium]
MTTNEPIVLSEHRFTAFMRNINDPDMPNVIHRADDARGYGYTSALVGGVTVYGWCVPAILEALGEEWLDRGWVEVFFRRPVYPDDRMLVRVTASEAGTNELTAENEADGAICIRGRVGTGDGPWLDQFVLSRRLDPEPAPDNKPALTLDNAPIGQDLRTLGIEMTAAEAREYAETHQRDSNPLFRGKRPLVHPAAVARQMMPLLAHSYEYGKPSIHVSSHIQHLARVEAGQQLALTCHFIDAYERKGHHYAVFDGDLIGEDGRELARLRHTNIFRVARRGS